MKKTADSIGAAGEKLAASFLKKKGYLIHTANYRCRYGEIDLVAEKDGVLAFIEVKTRANSRFGRPSDYVDIGKQSRILATARTYLSFNETDLMPRFDVIEILTGESGDFSDAHIHHIEGAFEDNGGSF